MWTGIPVTALTEEETAQAAAHGERRSTSASSARTRPSSPSARRSAARAPVSRTRSVPPARSSSSARRAWVRPSSSKALADVPVRQRGRAHPARHVRVHGEAHRLAPDRLASGLRRLRRGRPAHRARAPQAVLGHPVRRDREGAPGRVQRPAADPRRGSPDRRPGPQGRLQERHRHHDEQHRRARHREERVARLRAGDRERRHRLRRPSRSA